MKTFLKIILVTTIVFSILAIVAVACGTAVLQRYASSRVDDDLITDYAVSEKTSFYCVDRDDLNSFEMITNAKLDSGIRYKYVSYGELPQSLIDAFVAIEDKRFYSHNGIDYKRSIGAVLNYIFHGQKSFGGSTITQQLVKNLTGEDKPSIERKLKEAFSAMELERRLDKSEILEKYLNIINLSHGCVGVGAASEYYFSKNVSELSLAECASIAAITNNPSRYSPITNADEHVKRRNIVLSCMLEQGYISKREYDNAKASPLELHIPKEHQTSINSWYIDMVVSDVVTDLAQKYAIGKQTASWLLYRGGYKIYTAMDVDIQKILDEYYENEYNFPISDTGELPQSSMIVIDPTNGDILGVAGAVGQKKGNRIQNYAIDTKRPSGSVIKPLSVYAPAIERGLIDWSSLISDTPIIEKTESTQAWPKNANGKYEGDVTVKYAIDQSLNTVAVRVLSMVGNQNSFDFLKQRLRINSLNEKEDMGDAALALGQMSHGVTLREIVAAYSIFGSGVMSKPRSYFKVTDADGVVVLDNRAEREQVMSEESAAIMTKLLQSVVENGTAKGRISLTEKCEAAGKSGTTQNSCDRYYIGYTPTLLAGVWFGYEYPKPLHEFGGNFSITVWDEVMNLIYENDRYSKGETKFVVPDTVQRLTYNAITGKTDPADVNPDNGEVGWFDIR